MDTLIPDFGEGLINTDSSKLCQKADYVSVGGSDWKNLYLQFARQKSSASSSTISLLLGLALMALFGSQSSQFIDLFTLEIRNEKLIVLDAMLLCLGFTYCTTYIRLIFSQNLHEKFNAKL